MQIFPILLELNKENGSNYKLQVLKKYKDVELLKRVLKMCYDKVTFTYGVKKLWDTTDNTRTGVGPILELPETLDFLENKIVTRKLTGHDALGAIQDIMNRMWPEDQTILAGIINRDLRLNLGSSTINKVWPNLITKPPYMRCGVFSDKTSSKINFPAILQIKADGTFRYAIKDGESITFMSRTGEESEFPILKEQFLDTEFKDGVYVGELLVTEVENFQFRYMNRQRGNGLINSDNPPHENIFMDCWDYINLEEFNDPKHSKILGRKPYQIRFETLDDMVTKFHHKRFDNKIESNIRLINFTTVYSISGALKQCSEWMNEGYEGAILKDMNNVFKDHTSPTQLKLKLEIDGEMRITGFSEGTPGTKREQTFGAITYENDEGTIKGQCSGFTDKQLEDFNSRRDELIGKIITVQFNDITRAEGSQTYALSHPRFIELRNDKDETDTLERVLELRNMAMNLI